MDELNDPKPADKTTDKNFLVVGIGASAGGVEALQEFFSNMPANSDMVYVVILHLSPDYDSQLAVILQRTTDLPVTQVTEKVNIEPNHVYVVPPNQHLLMMADAIAVTPNLFVEDRRAPVDIFFRSLADTYNSRAVGVILSGTGANGSMGLKRIKEHGGAVFVQNPRETQFNEMPRNAIATDLVDGILPVTEIPAKLVAYKENLGNVHIATENSERPEDQQHALREVFTQLRVRTGHDFTNYKRPTLLRRIERRINVHNLQSLTTYATYLQQHPEEAHALLKDLLISVTNFFRDKKAFDAIETDILPRLLHEKGANNSLRIWVIGCATGEEAYSLAILCAERTFNKADAPKVQIFATDIDEDAIAVARNGLYSLNDAADVSPERLRRYFTKEGDSFRIRREIREMILFANHNVLKDPPFSHLDLVTCRNVMIYLNNTAQERVLETMHFALEPGGYLFLGSAESVDGASDLFISVNREQHIYQSRAVTSRFFPVPESVPSIKHVNRTENKISQEAESRAITRISYADLHQQLLEQYAPPSVVVNEDYDIVHLTERAGKYLLIGGGEPSKNLLKLIRPELRLDLRNAFYQAVQRRANVEARGLKIRIDDTTETINIHVRPVLREEDTIRGFMLVLFEAATGEPKEEQVVYTSNEPIAKHLEEELIRMKTQLRTNMEQQELQAEELKASNEELQAMNEELRSAVEELETSKEELQSINEELTTVNQELKVKVEETTISNNNFQNLINSTDIATIFLDRSLRIHMFTPAAREIFNMIPADYGRPVSDITNKLEYPKLLEDAEEVLDKLKTIEREIQAHNGNIYLMRALPYRTEEDRINGVIITFINITGRKRAEEALRQSEERMRLLIESAKDYAIFTLDTGRKVVTWSTGAEEVFGYSEREILGQPGDVVFTPEDQKDGAPEKEAATAEENGRAENERWHMRKNGSRFWGSGVTSPLRNGKGELVGFVKIMRDLTEQRQAEEAKATELKNTQLLRDLGMEVINEGDIQVLFDKIIAAGIELTRADAGTIQLYDETTEDLVLLAAQNFPQEMIQHFYRVGSHSHTSCGIALNTRERSFVDFDAPNVPDTTGTLRIHVENGFLSAQSTPLISRSGKFIGTITTHWHAHNYRPAEDELRYMDLLARQATDLIEQRQAEMSLRVREERKSFLLKISDSIRSVADPLEIQAIVNRTVMDYFKADRCYYCEVNGDLATIRQDAFTEGLPSVANTYSLSSMPVFKAMLQANRPVAIADVNTTELLDDNLIQQCIELKILSLLYVPLIKYGQPVGTLFIAQSTPRPWTSFEIELAGEIAERTWGAIERATAEEALHKLNKRNTEILESISDAFYAVDADFNFTYVNKKAEELWGRKRETLLGKNYWTEFPAAVNSEFYHMHHKKVLREGQPVQYETLSPLTGRWIDVSIYPNEHGGLSCYFRDITQRKEMEGALRSSEENLRLAIEAGNIGTCDWNYPSGEMRWNDLRFRMYGMEPQNRLMTTDDLVKIIHPADSERAIGEMATAIETTGRHTEEYRVVHPNGDVHWIFETGNVIEWQEEKPIRVISVLFDITLLHQSQEALRESEARYRAIVSQTSVGIARVDVSGNLVFLNAKACSMFGVGSEEAMGKTLWELTVEEDVDENKRLFKRLTDEGLPFQHEKRLKRSNGSVFWASVSVAAMKDENGKVLSAVAVIVDVTGRKKAEEALRETMERFEYAVQATKDVIWEIDFNRDHVWWSSMMHTILGYSQGEVKHSVAWYQSLIHPDDQQRAAESFSAAIEGNEALWADEFRYRQRSGEYKYVNCRSFIIREKDGKALKMIGAMQDVTERRKAEEAVRKSEEHLRIALEAGELGAWDWNLVSNKLVWNEQHYKLLGMEPKQEEIAPEAFLAFIHPEDLQMMQAKIEQAIQKTGIFKSEYRIKRRDNKLVRWMSGYGRITERLQGKPTRFAGVMFDNTERKNAEEAVRKSEERLRVTMESATDYVIITTNTSGNIENWNSGAERIFGYKAAEVIGKNSELIYTPEDRAAGVHALEMKTAREEGRAPDERWHLRKDGDRFYMIGVLAPIVNEGTVTGFVKVARDMTAQKQAEEALLAAQNSLNTALEAAHMGIWDNDLATDITIRSPRHDQLLGFPHFQEEWSHDKAKQHMVEEDKAKFDAARKRMFETGIFELEARIQQGDGSVCWVQLYGRLFRNGQGEPTHAAGVIFDISDRKTLEQKKDEFIGIASHELKTPVTSIKAYTEILEEKFLEAGDKESAGFLQKLNGQIDRLTTLIKDLLDATRISEGRLAMKKSQFSINQVLRDTAEDLQRTTNKHTIELQLEEVPALTGDKERLQQVFVNLVSNALKYSPDSDKVVIKAFQENGNVNIAVQDFGIGMSPETQNKLFERFFRSSDPHVSTFPGLGLGLYISMELVKQHKGTIKVHSEKGKGSVFTVVLPVNHQ